MGFAGIGGELIYHARKWLTSLSEVKFSSNQSTPIGCPYTVAAACLFLAGKVEENLLRIRDVINVFYRILHPENEPMEIDDRYWNIRSGLGDLEMMIFRSVSFNVTFDHPHKYLLVYLKSLEQRIVEEKIDVNIFAKNCWTILRDTYVEPDIVLSNKPQHVALAVIYIVSRALNVEFDAKDEFGRRPKRLWFELYSDNISERKLIQLAERIASIYDDDM